MNIRKFQPICGVVLSFFALSALSTNAQVTFYGVQKGPVYTQTTDDTPPTTADSYGVYAFFNTSNPGDATSFTVTDNDSGATINATGSGTSFGGTASYGSSGSPEADKEAMDADFTPGGTYLLAANGGTLDGKMDSLPDYADSYPDEMYVTGTGITNARAINPNSDFTINIGYSPNDGNDIGMGNSQSFAIFDQTTGSFIYNVYQNSSGQSTSAFEVPSSFLQTMNPSDNYLGQLTDFEIYNPSPTGDFAGANVATSDAFTQTTKFDLMVEAIPEPSQWGALVFLGATTAFGLRRSPAMSV